MMIEVRNLSPQTLTSCISSTNVGTLVIGNTNTPHMLCPDCDRSMKFIKTIPQSGVLSEIVVFYCQPSTRAEVLSGKRAA